MEIKIFDLDHKGNGIGKLDNKVVFVPKVVPGDICDIDIYKNYKNYNLGKLNKIIKSSVDRLDALCPYYEICGGCNISNLSYLKQIEYKTNKVKNIFKKYLNIEIVPNVIDSNTEYGYRNKITYHNDSKLGLISEFNSIVDIDNCLLVSDKINELYQEIKKLDISKVKMITIREFDNGLTLSILGELDIDNLKDRCVAIYMNNKCIYQKEKSYIILNNIKYMISNEAFFQINTNNVSKLYDEIVRLGNFNKDDEVIDLYCGVGSISLYIAKYVKSVFGVEIVESAIVDAKENAGINKINNVKFLAMDVQKLSLDDIDGNKLIVDPPRIGIDKKTINILNEKKIPTIVYVSCDPMTLVRDIKLLDNYKLVNVSVIDMFPQTHHIETLCVLEMK